jgi:hypothetical protein
MKCRWFCIGLLVGVGSFVGPAYRAVAQEDTVIKGQAQLGVHKLKMENKSIYQIEIKAKGFIPGVNLIGANQYIPNTADFFKERHTFRCMFMPVKSMDYTLVVTPNIEFGAPPPLGLLDYTVTMKTLKIDEKPLFTKADKLTAQDPKYQQSINKTAFKAYPFKMTKGKTYIIDMVATAGGGNKLDPYLYLENSNKITVAQDDDGGGFPNARVMYTAVMDGEFRIIASALNNRTEVGDYTLTVRTVTDAK